MSANPEFLDQLDADVPDNSFDTVTGGEDVPEPSNDQANDESSRQSIKDGSHGSSSGQDEKSRDERNGQSIDGLGEPNGAKDKIDPKQDDKFEKVVPLRALQEEREAAKELKRQIAELNAQPKLTAEDAELLKELKAQRAVQQAPKEVDFMEDPKGYVDSKVQRALETLKKTDEKAEAVNSQVNAQRQMQALMGAITASEQAFVGQNSDYYEALNHVRAVRANQIRLMSPDATPAQVSQVIEREELTAAHSLLAKGQDPCKFAYEYAKTLGYAKKAAAAPPVAKIETDKSAARTMGAGGADAATDDAIDSDDPNSEFKAVKAMFKGKR